MRPWARYLICGLVGLSIGIGGAVYTVRAGALGDNDRIGPWVTGTRVGTAAADTRTRAVVALKGLLALPGHEARYYTAATDNLGNPLDGGCRYRITGGALPAAWWSLTAYDPQGYLIPNPANRYSVSSGAFPNAGEDGWLLILAPTPQLGAWLPSGGIAHLELTLRTYLPVDGGTGNLPVTVLPSIVKEGC